jgi:uncharacterized membrane protein
MNSTTAKNLGGVGAILIVVACLGLVGSGFSGILIIAGAIVLLIGMKGLADNYSEPGIFNNALYGVITGIVGIVVTVAVLIVSFISFLSVLPPGFDWTSSAAWQQLANTWQQQIMEDPSAFWAIFGGVITGVIIAVVILFVFFIIAFVLFRRSMTQLSQKTGVGLFGTAGLLMLVGAALTIVGIGLLLIWIGFIVLAVAFFSVKQTTSTPQPPPQPTAPS